MGEGVKIIAVASAIIVIGILSVGVLAIIGRSSASTVDD